jgi:anti-sigma B factor antagonist
MNGAGNAELKLSVRAEGPARVLAASGQLTERECAQFLAALKTEMGASSQRLVLDLTGLMYMSSAGLGTLVSVHKKFADAGRRMILAGANQRVRKLLALTSLDRLIENTDSVAEALNKP